jgi:ABC-type Co2+ transport system permease subunit
MKDFVTSSALTRLLANVFVFVVLVAAVGVLSYQIINNQQVNPICYSVVSGGLTYAVAMLSVHAGAQLPGVVVTQPRAITESVEEK